jgi:hypothetical protein
MTSNIILECRQKDTPNVSANGIYESYLANEVVINEGDVLIMKNAFIDTKKEGNIIIEDDLILSMNYGVFFTDWLEDTVNKKEYVNSSGVDIFTIAGQVNYYNFGSVYAGQKFIPYYFQSSTGEEFQQVNSVTYKALGQTFGEQSPAMPVTYQYIDALTGNAVVIHRTIPASEPNVVYVDELGFLIKSGSFQILSPSMRDMELEYFWKFISQDIVNVASEGVYSPYIFTKSFTLPAGSYSPNNLSLLISKLMSDNNINNTGLPISYNSFVKYVSEFAVGAPYPNGASGTIGTDGTYFISSDMSSSLRFGATPPALGNCPNYLFGATQTALEFDAESNTFSFQYLHSPIYDLTTGNNISVRIANIGKFVSGGSNPVISNYYLKTTDNGGIFFTGLSAKIAKNNKDFDFWAGVLGFNLDKICVSPRKPITTEGTNTYFGLTGTFYSYDIDFTNNLTTGYCGVDASIIKKVGDLNWYTLSTVGIPASSDAGPAIRQKPAIFSTIDETTPLIADTPYNQLIDTSSHYIIDADLHFIGDFIGRDKYNNIQGTVSKYYQVANYIIGDSDGAIQYQHRGMPLILRSIRIRILKSDKKQDLNLGSDNTIMFQLIKSSKV